MKKGLSAIDLCPICGIYFETTLHVIRDCEIVKDMWKSIGNSLIKNLFFQQPLKIWLEENLLDETRKCQGIEWPLVFSTAYCLLWYSRNLFIFEGCNNAHAFIACTILKLAKDYNQCL